MGGTCDTGTGDGSTILLASMSYVNFYTWV